MWWGIFKGTIGCSVCTSTRHTVQLQRTPPPPPLPVFSSRRRHQRGLLTLTRVGIRHLRSHTGRWGGCASLRGCAPPPAVLQQRPALTFPRKPSPSPPSLLRPALWFRELAARTVPCDGPRHWARVLCVCVCVCVLTLAGKVSPLLICCQTFRYTQQQQQWKQRQKNSGWCRESQTFADPKGKIHIFFLIFQLQLQQNCACWSQNLLFDCL